VESSISCRLEKQTASQAEYHAAALVGSWQAGRSRPLRFEGLRIFLVNGPLARNQKRVEDVDSSGPDHGADAVRYGCLRCDDRLRHVTVGGNLKRVRFFSVSLGYACQLIWWKAAIDFADFFRLSDRFFYDEVDKSE